MGEDEFGYSDPGADRLDGGLGNNDLTDESYYYDPNAGKYGDYLDDLNELLGGGGNDYLYGTKDWI